MTGLWSPSNSQNAPPPPTPAPSEPPSDPAPEDTTLDTTLDAALNADIADTGIVDIGPPPGPPASHEPNPSRPQIQRDQVAPPPPHQPPPPPAPQQVGHPDDSLSLLQLKRIVSDFPRVEPTSYAFTYADTASFEEEIDEWFGYANTESLRVNRARVCWGGRWKQSSKKLWMEEERSVKSEFVRKECEGLKGEAGGRRKSLQRIMHILLGVWDESAGTTKPLAHASRDMGVGEEEPQIRSQATKSQVDAMKDGVALVTECGGVAAAFQAMAAILGGVRNEEYRELRESQMLQGIGQLPDEIDNSMTVMYILIHVTLTWPEEFSATKEALGALKPNLLEYLLTTVAKLRWDDVPELPQNKIFNLFWKSLLLIFGNMSELDTVKAAVAENLQAEGKKSELITASPLDYHIFRQEITSKYPAYIPPAPLLPLELDNNSILPPLPNHPPRNTGQNGIIPTPATANSGGSILHQPVHIATPAPSPPPSPPVGGKAGKKQNYQTNQNFPFMYPPLDSTSNNAGGKGTAGLQGELVGRKWEGSEIPASILEAGELFAKRMKMTRAMRQLWDEREAFLKHERGWDGHGGEDDPDFDVDELELDEALSRRLEALGREDEEEEKKVELDLGSRPVSEDVKKRLEVVEDFYGNALPQMQSLVIVLLKAVLANVTALITQPITGQPQQQNGLQPGFQSESNLRNNAAGQRRLAHAQEAQNPSQPAVFDVRDLPIEDLEALRQREITLKAVSGILLVLLKWFKVSYVLKFEYLTQLLLDSNYLPLILKLFAHQDVDKLVDTDSDRAALSFFTYCNKSSKHPGTPPPAENSESEDDAAPPPIKRNRLSPSSATDKLQAITYRSPSAIHSPLRVDELGAPLPVVPAPPSTNYSWRNFYSAITLLRVMQKICKGKAHRNLLLVQYKSSNIIKKALKVPQHELRLYTLKLFKSQVPYCGRKWRQGNMRVITAVYLHCRPDLRDEWLSGSDVDGDMEEALPLEQALRSLTHWGNVRRYKKVMAGEVSTDGGEGDFFRRELEKMEIMVGSDGEEVEAETGWEGAGQGWQ
ncbi:Factor arrest protein 11 [Pseudogymnoascus verrucosus]|uniref:Factor arrest protein 11 n=1 Tax=Pseudogymnoascus verrucosus TaxID=342668 RepID=A0A1B8GA42_9PEZI|nr:Factor arrest protein 11 [Pseudogymnoascus verrucosus]OBT92702.1 Factor arrest protein 11 [Pseudogymnoascus verrucosus]